MTLNNFSHINGPLFNSPMSKILASIIDLSFENGTIKNKKSKNKINDNFKIVVENENENLNQSTDETL